MTIDLDLKNESIDFLQEWLAERRQRRMVYIGAPNYGSTILHGKYSSFKNVIAEFSHSKMALQIDGTV